ncbi:hypothetical protein EVG20_g8274 [Dentipellis fragilis]|uniref:Up-regulated during septation protein 1 domain-containing protein n=1 Tax=Dentipellis fragilis TaxID=205917 RepID=A0A4Y9Y974_9AGAM|nr:hypothetical protein EVG20_g8274 [Dentipellis fragilis]
MNGMRRFLGGGSGTPPPASAVPLPAVTPLSLGNKSPAGSPSTSPSKDVFSLDGIPSPSTPGLKIRKDKQRSRPPTPENGRPATNGSSGIPRRPVPSSPRSGLASLSIRKSAPLSENGNGGEWKRASGFMNTRDELLISLLSSEAVVESRGYDILNAEEVEELKKEHQVLSSRLEAMRKKLALETKIRDAAINLAKVNVAHKRVSKQSSEQVDTANKKVETAQRELWRVLERTNDVYRRLLEHRAAVLGFSVRELERKTATNNGNGAGAETASGYSTPSRSTQLSPVSSVTSASISSKARFDGAHLRRPLAEVLALEERLRLLSEEMETREGEVALLKEERGELEERARGGGEMAGRVRELEDDLMRYHQERDAWEDERRVLEERGRQVEILERRLEVLEEKSGESVDLQDRLLRAEASGRADTDRLREEFAAERARWDDERQAWEREKALWQQQRDEWIHEKDSIEEKCKDEIDNAREGLRALVQQHDIPLYSRDTTLAVLVDALGKHLESGGGSTKVRQEIEEQLALEMEKRQVVTSQLDDARARVASLEKQLKERPSDSFAERIPSAPINFAADAGSIVALLQPVWATLPSPEARALASRTGGARAFRTASGSPTAGPGSPKAAPSSISDMDVRSLKTLYSGEKEKEKEKDGKGVGTFSVEAFATRVRALIADDRALIERLIRFAQAHDLLKKNAERAQKLAQEANSALETYQRQVKTLEDRHLTMTERQAVLQNEVQELQETVERLEAEKRDLETQAAEQAETCRQLTDANTALSARTLTLAEEHAASSTSSEGARRQIEAQLAEARAALEKNKEEIASMQMNEQMQRITLLEELNTIQTENGNLRAQLRAAGVKK